jgi:hypothetical protein
VEARHHLYLLADVAPCAERPYWPPDDTGFIVQRTAYGAGVFRHIVPLSCLGELTAPEM